MSIQFNENGHAISSGNVRVFYYASRTNEYCGWSDEFITAGVSLPGNATLVDPGDSVEGYAWVFDKLDWVSQEDHRAEIVYSTDDGMAVEVNYIGPIRDGYTTIAPSSPYDKWTGSEWVTDTDAKHEADVIAAGNVAPEKVPDAPDDGTCYVRQNGEWVQQGAFDVGVAASTGEVDALSHQLFTLDGTKDNTVTFQRLPAGRAMVIALVFKGKGGKNTWPSNLAWSQNEIPVLTDIRTVVSILWDGETLTGTTSMTV